MFLLLIWSWMTKLMQRKNKESLIQCQTNPVLQPRMLILWWLGRMERDSLEQQMDCFHSKQVMHWYIWIYSVSYISTSGLWCSCNSLFCWGKCVIVPENTQCNIVSPHKLHYLNIESQVHVVLQYCGLCTFSVHVCGYLKVLKTDLRKNEK